MNEADTLTNWVVLTHVRTFYNTYNLTIEYFI